MSLPPLVQLWELKLIDFYFVSLCHESLDISVKYEWSKFEFVTDHESSDESASSRRTVFFLTEFQIDGMLEALRLELVDRVRSFRSMEGSVSGDFLGNYGVTNSNFDHSDFTLMSRDSWHKKAKQKSIKFNSCQECSKNSTLFAQFLLSPLTYVSLSYFVHLHCANVHTPLCFSYP